jgi:hypothetical protein
MKLAWKFIHLGSLQMYAGARGMELAWHMTREVKHLPAQLSGSGEDCRA